MQMLTIAEQSNVELKKKLPTRNMPEKVLTRLWRVHKDKPRIRGSAYARPMISWLLLRNKWQPLGNNLIGHKLNDPL